MCGQNSNQEQHGLSQQCCADKLEAVSGTAMGKGYQQSYSPVYLWQCANALMSTQTLCSQVPNPEVVSKKENKKTKESINSGSVVSYRCVK